MGSTVDLCNRKIMSGAQPYLDKLGEAYDSYREKQAKEIDAITTNEKYGVMMIMMIMK